MIYYIPNILTLARIALVPWLIVLLQEHEFQLSLLVFVVAGVTDALDGFIAKRFNASSKLGAILDPLADKALLVSSYVMLSVMELIPFWLMVVVVFRDIAIIGGFLILVLFYGSIEMKPLRSSKLNTFLQISFIALMLAALGFELETLLYYTHLMAWLILATSVWSGIGYVAAGSKVTNASDEQRRDA